MILGTDHHGVYDGKPDFQMAYASGSRFTFLKAVDGNVPTPNFSVNADAAKRAGIYAGAYVWLYPASRIGIRKQTDASSACHLIALRPGFTIPCRIR